MTIKDLFLALTSSVFGFIFLKAAWNNDDWLLTSSRWIRLLTRLFGRTTVRFLYVALGVFMMIGGVAAVVVDVF